MNEPPSETKYIRCPHCGLEQWEGYKVCRKCGQLAAQNENSETLSPKSLFFIGALTGWLINIIPIALFFLFYNDNEGYRSWILGFIHEIEGANRIAMFLGFIPGGLGAILMSKNIYGNKEKKVKRAILGGIVAGISCVLLFILIFPFLFLLSGGG